MVLAPCAGCRRHVRLGEHCPFCGASTEGVSAPSPVLSSRAMRVVLMAAGMELASCVTKYGAPPPPDKPEPAPSASASASASK